MTTASDTSDSFGQTDMTGFLLSNPVVDMDKEFDSLDEFMTFAGPKIEKWGLPIDQAIVGGFCADRLAYAFAAGYRAALQRLVPSLPPKQIVSLCVTEENGAHPNHIHTSLSPDNSVKDTKQWVMFGKKTFITCADQAQVLLIAASKGRNLEGKNDLCLVMIDHDQKGVLIDQMQDLPFIPEINHGIVSLERVVVSSDRILPGDGYLDYIKPFRTIEDIHVTAALLGYLTKTGRCFKWNDAAMERILCITGLFRDMGHKDYTQPALHILLGGAFQLVNDLIVSLESLWPDTKNDISQRWHRDKKLLNIAQNARSQRLKKAWQSFH